MSDQAKEDTKAQACPKCGGAMLARGVYGAIFSQSQDKILFSNRQTSKMAASVCNNCGYAELYATHPDKLRELSPSGRDKSCLYSGQCSSAIHCAQRLRSNYYGRPI